MPVYFQEILRRGKAPSGLCRGKGGSTEADSHVHLARLPVDALGFLMALGVLCHAEANDKINLLFDMADLNGKGVMGKDEFVVALLSMALPLSLLTTQSLSPPSLEACEAFIASMFARYDRSLNGTIAREELRLFVVEQCAAQGIDPQLPISAVGAGPCLVIRRGLRRSMLPCGCDSPLSAV